MAGNLVYAVCTCVYDGMTGFYMLIAKFFDNSCARCGTISQNLATVSSFDKFLDKKLWKAFRISSEGVI